MTGQQLRNSILQEAIQGRLVPNVLEPGEKTGAELLQDILAKHQKENTERGKKGKRITLSTIEEEPWELPEEWCWCLLPNVATIEYGFPFDSTKFNSSRQGTPLIRIRDVVPGYTKTYTTESASKEHLVRKGDMLTGMDGNFNVNFWDSDDAYLNQRVCRITANKQIIEQRYLYYYLPIAFKEIEEGVSFVTVKHLSDKHLKAIAIPLPPRSIQRKIVEVLDGVIPQIEAFDKAAGELEALNKILPDKLRKSVLQEAIHGSLVSNDIPEGEATGAELLQQILKERQDRENKEKGKKAKKLTLSTIEEEPWELPEGWCWARLGDVMTFVNGRAYKKEELLSSGKYKVLRVGNFFTNYSWYYSDLELPDEKYCFKGDLLYAWSASFGPWIWEGDKTIFHYHIWNVKFNEDKLCKKYLYWFFEADKHIIKESTTGSTMIHVSMENMMPRLIPIPPLSIQLRIVEKIEEVFSAINKLQA